MSRLSARAEELRYRHAHGAISAVEAVDELAGLVVEASRVLEDHRTKLAGLDNRLRALSAGHHF